MNPRSAHPTDLFDARYYERYYENARTRVTDPVTIAKHGRFVAAYLEVLDLPVARVLDIGCGLGWWRDALATSLPKAKYTGVEFSHYLVDKLGWEHGSVIDYRADRPFDLVICQGVLQYLPHKPAAVAIENLATLTRGALFLEALTSEDWAQNCDTRRTDGGVHLRTGAWYRRRLKPHFVNCGGGVFAHRNARPALFELEQLG